MKKKLLILVTTMAVIIFIIAFIKTVKIEKDPVENPGVIRKLSNDEILTQVLNRQKEFINEKGIELLLNDFSIEEEKVRINAYQFVDLDGDLNNEVVAITDSFYGYYLVLNIDSNIIYGYTISKSEMKYINNRGIIYNKDDSDNKEVFKRIKFDKNKYKFIELASHKDDEYIIDDHQTDEKIFSDYINDYLKSGYLSYLSLSTNWMKKTLTGKYSIRINKNFEVNSKDSSFLFVTDNLIENFSYDLLDNKFNLYFMDSNSNIGKINIKRKDDNFFENNNEINDKKSVGIYDELSQYIVVIVNNDRLSGNIDDDYKIYYFKYYNKGIQYLGIRYDVEYKNSFNEDILNTLVKEDE